MTTEDSGSGTPLCDGGSVQDSDDERGARSEYGMDRERIGRLVVDADLSEEEKSKLVFALGRDTPFHAEQQTEMRIDVYRLVGTDGGLSEHEMRCRTCGEAFDMRDLSGVVEHEECEGWEQHEETCDDCGSSTHTNGEIVHCDSCDWWDELEPSRTEGGPMSGQGSSWEAKFIGGLYGWGAALGVVAGLDYALNPEFVGLVAPAVLSVLIAAVFARYNTGADR